MKWFLCSLFIVLFPSAVFSKTVLANLTPYEASYDLRRDGDSVGSAQRVLKSLDQNNWQLSMAAEAKMLFLSFSYTQESHFQWHDELPRPYLYRQVDSGSFKSTRTLEQQFDWANMLENGGYKKANWQLKLVPNVYDRQTVLLALRLKLMKQKNKTESQQRFSYKISYKGKITDNIFEQLGEEIITTNIGDFKTLKFKKIHNNPKRISYFWLAPDHDFLPIRIQQLKDGKGQADMLLTSFKDLSL